LTTLIASSSPRTVMARRPARTMPRVVIGVAP
jgi:hypothetical protein